MNEVLKITTLGGLDIRRWEEPVVGFKSNKERALLVYLAVESHHSRPRESLAGLLWPDYPEQSARANLRRALANLRQVIGDREVKPPFLDISRQTIRFNRDSAAWLDVIAFSDLIAARVSGSEATDALEEAIELYQGSFLEGFSLPDSPPFEEWALLERERLQRLFVQALFQLAVCYQRRGQYEMALQHGRRLLELDPLLEEAHRQVMLCLMYSGQRSAALAQYEACCGILARELGVDPEAETTALYERILMGEIAAPTHTPPQPAPHNLPPQATPLVGRKDELAELDRLLSEPGVRLVTVVGPGGMGKTRLALECATGQLDRFEHGVYFVALAPLQAREAIVPAVADAVGFTFYEAGEPRQQLLDYLRNKQLLLVMDNYEHLLDGAELVSDVIQTAPKAKVLVTSRTRLNLQEEQLYPLTGMDYPDWETPEDTATYSAVQLFLQGARRVEPGFDVSSADLKYLTRVCRLVDGTPLAVLLAAGWVDTLAPSEIAHQIGRSFDFLETEVRNVPERQRSMRAAFDHSWNLLTALEQQVMQALSVFRGGFTWVAAQAVCAASLRELRALVDRSLVQHTSDRRLEMHELLRQYAEERLDASPRDGAAVRDRHCAFFTSALEAWGEDLKSARSQEALAEMRADRENMRVAWEWALDHRQVERLDQILENLAMFLYREGRHREGYAASRRAFETLAAMDSVYPDHPEASRREGERQRVMAKSLAIQGGFSAALGREDARRLLNQALAGLDKPELIAVDTQRERASITYWLGNATLNTGELKAAKSCYEKSLALYRALGDDFFSSAVLTRLGDVAQDQGAHDEAKQLCEESLVLARALGERFCIGFSLQRLSRIASALGQVEEAERLGRECVQIFQKLGSRFDTAGGLNYLGWALFWQGRFAEAQSTFERSVMDLEDLGLRRYPYLLRSIIGLGHAALGLGQYERAGEQGQRCLALAREAGARWEVGQSLALLGSAALVEGTFDEAQNMFREGAAAFEMFGSPEAVASFATWLSFADWGLGQTRVAGERLCEGLRTIIEHQYYLPLVPALSATALLLADEGHACAEQAVELYALASRYGYVGNSRWFEDVIGKHITAVAATLPPDVVAAAQERGRARDLWATAQELLEQLQRPDRFPTNPVRS